MTIGLNNNLPDTGRTDGNFFFKYYLVKNRKRKKMGLICHQIQQFYFVLKKASL